MKRIYFLATAAVFVLAGCTKSESLDGLLTQDLEISFEAFSGNATKVGFAPGSITDDNFQFASVAFYTEESDAWTNENGKTTGIPWDGKNSLGTQWLRFTDIKAVKDNNNRVSFKSDTKAYWPRQGYLNFFSWYPSGVNAEMSKGALMIKDYIIAPAANVDLMVADPALGLSRIDADYSPDGANYSGVKTMFRHKLTKIGVEAKIKDLGESNLESFTVTVKEVKINNVCNKGTFQGSLDNNYLGAWAVDETTDATYSFPMPNDGIDVVYSYTTAAASPYYKSVVDDEIMLLPQTKTEMGNDAILKLTCDLKYTIKGSSEVITEQNHVYQTTISDSQQQGGPEYPDWGINKYVIYRLVFGLDEIEWAPVVENWETESVEPIEVE